METANQRGDWPRPNNSKAFMMSVGRVSEMALSRWPGHSPKGFHWAIPAGPCRSPEFLLLGDRA